MDQSDSKPIFLTLLESGLEQKFGGYKSFGKRGNGSRPVWIINRPSFKDEIQIIG
jgi:hypothetical protein